MEIIGKINNVEYFYKDEFMLCINYYYKAIQKRKLLIVKLNVYLVVLFHVGT